MKKMLFSAMAALPASQAWPHSGHGAPGPVHWHATDFAGLAVFIVAALLAAWIANRK